MTTGMPSAQPTTIFNDMQIQLLRMFSVNRSKRGLDELCDVLYKHYLRRMNEKLDDLWTSGILDEKRLAEINQMDLHQLQYQLSKGGCGFTGGIY